MNQDTRMGCAGITEGSMSQWVVASQNVGTQSHTNPTHVAVLQAQTQTNLFYYSKQTPRKYFLCGQLGHSTGDCPQKGNKTQVWKGPPLSLCPSCHKGYHWGSECCSKFGINGKPIANQTLDWMGGRDAFQPLNQSKERCTFS